QAFVYPGAMSALVRDYLDRLNRGESLPRTVLTEREDEVLKLIAEGHSTREIARELTISYKTVERHRENILAKLGLRDRTQVTRYAIRAGLIEP
ncbi:MAG TPA: response regulator transcription factor, partial [Nocardioides sp.]